MFRVKIQFGVSISVMIRHTFIRLYHRYRNLFFDCMIYNEYTIINRHV